MGMRVKAALLERKKSVTEARSAFQRSYRHAAPDALKIGPKYPRVSRCTHYFVHVYPLVTLTCISLERLDFDLKAQRVWILCR